MEGGQPIKKKSTAARALGWMGEHVAGTVLGFAVTALLTAGVVWVTGKDKTEGQEIDQVRMEITNSGLEIRQFQEVSMHAGATSYVMTVGRPSSLEPDEIRIYDAEGDSLEQRFSFAPSIRSADDDVIVNPETFEILTVRDIDGDGQSELVGSYVLESATAFLQMPVTIVWDSGGQRYQLRPLIDEEPRPAPGRDVAAREEIEPFESPFVVTDDAERFEGWATERVALLEKSLFQARQENLYLGGSYPAPDQELGQTLTGKKLQVAYWVIVSGTSESSPYAGRMCWNDDERLLEEEVRSGEQEEDAIARGWARLVKADERSRRGEVSGEEAVYVGGILDGSCILGE